ncbi:MAG: imidazole glycerol phosphate synthase subunit HisH [Anaerolineales bacterium]|nr:imidazole glycerol phosphate synthase subunit HisH [Anaerolineales bacterium]
MIHIIDYKAGNITSVQRALAHLGAESVITPDPDILRRAGRVIFPGVGQAASAMRVLRERGLDLALREVFARGIPILGICLGSQIILDRSEEGDTACLGLLPGVSQRFALADPALKIPHMGWNRIRILRRHPVLEGVRPEEEFYFVHSYYPAPDDPQDAIAECEYGRLFPAVIGRGSLIAAQFHPEKSGPAGLRILENFSRWDGRVD